jgi:hypothetical protein
MEQELPSPVAVRRRADRLAFKRDETRRRRGEVSAELTRLDNYLGIADEVTAGLEVLNRQLFQELLQLVEEKLTIALQEVLGQPVTFHAEVSFKRNAAAVEFWIERDGNKENVYHGQGGSVANVLSVGLRMFALTTQDPSRHRRFLVLDEQDCWLRPDLVPMLVKIVHDAGRGLGFQVLMISHHDTTLFERYAERVYRFVPVTDGAVKVEQVGGEGDSADPD